MKVVLGCAASIVFAVTLLPVVLSSGDAAPAPTCNALSGQMSVLLETIRTLESGGDYAAESQTSSASGAYQFVDGTWAGYGGYQHASAAPADCARRQGCRAPCGDSRPSRRGRHRRSRRLVSRPPTRRDVTDVGPSPRGRQRTHTTRVPDQMALDVPTDPRSRGSSGSRSNRRSTLRIRRQDPASAGGSTPSSRAGHFPGLPT